MQRYNILKAIVSVLFLAINIAMDAQLFTPLGLGVEKCEPLGPGVHQQMHIEGDTLYVCTKYGLYFKNLSIEDSSWQLAGFENVPVQNYVRRRNEILALRYSVANCSLLLSLNGGSTYEDVTPDEFRQGDELEIMTLTNIEQDPVNPNRLLVSSDPWGLYQSADFGQTWYQLTYDFCDFIGYNPFNRSVIYESGTDIFLKPFLNISYDGGQTWTDFNPDSSEDGFIGRIAFHPTDSVRWLAGGSGAVYTSSDNGHTWDWSEFEGVHWYFTEYDNKNSDIVYMAGHTSDNIMVMCSIDGGKTWGIPQTVLIKKITTENLYDLKQYGNKLLIYSETDVYSVEKNELIASLTSSNSGGYMYDFEDDTIYYTLQDDGAFVAAWEISSESFRNRFGFDGPLTPRDPLAGGLQPRTPLRGESHNETESATVTDSMRYQPYRGIIVIPESVSANDTSYTVTGIDYYAFMGSRELESVFIPESVKRLGYGSFAGCTGLSTVNLPSGITGIPDAMFYGCTSLGNMVIPEGVDIIGHSAFYECTGLSEIVIPASVKLIDEYAFAYCTGLERVVIEGNPEIAETAFIGCGTELGVIRTGIDGAFANDGKVSAPVHYGIDGRVIDADTPGLHIIRMPDGRIQKALKLSK